jgi:hypothetical protein
MQPEDIMGLMNTASHWIVHSKHITRMILGLANKHTRDAMVINFAGSSQQSSLLDNTSLTPSKKVLNKHWQSTIEVFIASLGDAIAHSNSHQSIKQHSSIECFVPNNSMNDS